MKPRKGDNIHPGPAFWLVLIVIGGATIWQKASAPPKPVTDVKTGKIVSGVQANYAFGLFEGENLQVVYKQYGQTFRVSIVGLRVEHMGITASP